MCRGCYAEYGEPHEVTNITDYAVELIGKVYEDDCVAGNVHIVLDDWNIEDEWIDTMLEKDELTPNERACMYVMRNMAENERATALAIYDKFITV